MHAAIGGLALAIIASAAAPAGADIFERNARLGRGVNFGNILEAPKEGDWGLTFKEEYFRLVADAGFKSVRIPIKWSAHAAAQSPWAIDAAFLARVDWAVEQSLKQGLAVVINVHHYDEMASDPAAHKARWLGLWRQIAARYKDQPKDVYFELMNEPNTALNTALWNQFLIDGIAAVRETNPDRPLIVGPSDWNGIWRLKDLAVPASERNLIVTVHFYNPFQFTHQGAEWSEGSAAWLGRKWGTPADQDAVEKEIKSARDWGVANGRPIYMGEFGAYSKAEMASRAAWTRFVARTAEKYGMSWAYWEFGSGFGVYDPAASRWRTELKDALLADPMPVKRTGRPASAGKGGIRIALDGAGRPGTGLAFAAPRGGWSDAKGRPAE